MTPQQRLAFIQACERAGFTVEAEELRGVMLVSIRDGHGYVARAMHPRRFDFEEAARQFYAFQQQGGRRHRSVKVELAA